jgi:predicted GTPase
MLGYKENHVKSARVGEIETTLEPKSYKHPVLPTLYLWDMPGIGTPRHPTKSYFENYCLGAFDAILIVFDDRLMASDVELARKAYKYHVPVFFVKNKADLVNKSVRYILIL